ncbi:DNA polymerase sliding clamp, partial [ANME-1 cluster archaeon ex4572_4]
MDFVKLLGILGIGGRGGEEIELKLDEKGQKLFTRMGSLAYTISLLASDSLRKDPKVPELEFPAQVILEIEDFKRGIRAAEKIAENIVLGVDGE